MMRQATYRVLVLLCCWSVQLAALPQQDEPTYRVESEVTIAGTVTRLSVHTGKRGTPRSRATLKTTDGTDAEIHIGPSGFVHDKGMELAVGDVVSVVGSQVIADDAPLVIVRRLSRGQQVLDLRNPAGRPLWEDRYK
jgi:hypothetical protein